MPIVPTAVFSQIPLNPVLVWDLIRSFEKLKKGVYVEILYLPAKDGANKRTVKGRFVEVDDTHATVMLGKGPGSSDRIQKVPLDRMMYVSYNGIQQGGRIDSWPKE